MERRTLAATPPQTMHRLARATAGMAELAVEKVSRRSREDPFRVLVATMLSAQTKDAVTAAAADRLFRVARTPTAMARLPASTVRSLIYPVSFYRTKARHVRETSRQLLDRFRGRVPRRMADLLSLPGVGRKTANLVLILSHASQDNICVDTHVHRIANRLGWVRTRSPEATERALYRVMPRRYWPLVNLRLVTWGQNVCRPVSPRCHICAIRPVCPRIGVTRERR
jgi:endonuclease-3